MNKYQTFVLNLIFLQMSACMSVLTDAQKITARCDTKNSLENEIIQCYKQENAKYITRKVNMSVHGLTTGDWPFDYQFIYEVDLASTGKVKNIDMVNESNSHRLNKVVSRAVRKMSNFYVPKNDLFAKGGFDALKLMVVPARTPILEDDIIIDQNTILIYLTEICSLRSDRC